MPETIRLALELAPLPNGFQGNPQQYAEALVERLRVLFPTGIWTFQVQDTEPPTNQGPWIKGNQLWLWNEAEKRYTPLDISPSWQVAMSPTEPPDPAVTPLWVQFNPLGNFVTGFFIYLGGVWMPIFGAKGTTDKRPLTPPDWYRYFDTDIQVELYFQAGGWHTVSGSPGDIKFVKFPTLAEALKFNPGWQEFGAVMGPARGRVFVPAHKDAGTTPAASFPPLTGITARYATESLGEEGTKLKAAQLPPHKHPSWLNALSHSGSGPGNTGDAGGGDNDFTTEPKETGENATTNDLVPVMQPTLALWCLIKNGP